MVISHIFGRLGNQLFQYAAGRCVADKYNVPLKLDVSEFKDHNMRDFDLEKFNTRFEIATDAEIKALRPDGNIAKVLLYLKPKNKRTYHRERFFHYDKRFKKIGPHVYLKGYFQSERYFAPIADTLRKEFVIDQKHISSVTSLASSLRMEESVSVHIRRGDYTNADPSAILSALPLNYYSTAIELIQKKVSPSSLYFFSDDIEWAKKNLSIKNATYVSGIHSNNHLQDFYLMSQCRHNIIANSSFSWWCAWLNDNPAKTVIAPRQWFINKSGQKDDRLPASWLKI
jgi:hypothetical protein